MYEALATCKADALVGGMDGALTGARDGHADEVLQEPSGVSICTDLLVQQVIFVPTGTRMRTTPRPGSAGLSY